MLHFLKLILEFLKLSILRLKSSSMTSSILDN